PPRTADAPNPPHLPYTTLFRSDAVAADGDVAHQVRTRPRAFADKEEGRFRAVGIEQVEDRRRVRRRAVVDGQPDLRRGGVEAGRSEEHTSELQSRENHVCRLLL